MNLIILGVPSPDRLFAFERVLSLGRVEPLHLIFFASFPKRTRHRHLPKKKGRTGGETFSTQTKITCRLFFYEGGS